MAGGVQFRQPFQLVVDASQKTAEYTKSIDPTIEKAITMSYEGFTATKTKVETLPKKQFYMLCAAGLVVAGSISMFLMIPAIIFFPITIFLGAMTAIGLIAFTPVILVAAWILCSSAPINKAIVQPVFAEAIKNEKVSKILFRGADQKQN